MYHGDRLPQADARRLRLPPALGARQPPAQLRTSSRSHINQVVYVSATPGPYEHEHSEQVVEQIVRPTGLIDPSVEVKPTAGPDRRPPGADPHPGRARRARPRDHADEEDGRGPGRLPGRDGRPHPLPPLRDRHPGARRDPARPAPRASTTSSSASTSCARGSTCRRSASSPSSTPTRRATCAPATPSSRPSAAPPATSTGTSSCTPTR